MLPVWMIQDNPGFGKLPATGVDVDGIPFWQEGVRVPRPPSLPQ